MTKDERSSEAIEKAPPPEDNLVISHHTVTIGAEEISYTVTCGTMVLKEEVEGEGEKAGRREGEKAKAEVFFIAYTRDGVEEQGQRPLTFSFNGGPGSSSVWLHLGALGPKRVQLDDDGFPSPPPYRLVNNESSLLDVTDLVFIDPVSTGYSRVAAGEKAEVFYTFKKDIESIGAFIRLYTSRYRRWLSPKFIIGESYGTTRAAALSGHLQERHGMYLSGLMLISCVLDFTTLLFATNNDLPPVLFLPSYAATAHYHGRLPAGLQRKELKKVLAEVEAFALDEYAPALLKGSSLAEDERLAVTRKLARYTGLNEAYLERTNLRVDIFRFVKELLRDERRTVGRIDSRYKGIDRDAGGERFEYDPSLAATNGPYTATFNDYVRWELRFESDLPYEILSYDVNRAWKWERENTYLDTAETLRKAMNMNPNLRIHVANGYYDLATPHFATEYTINHLGLEPELQDNISMSYYHAGHMMYVHRPSLEKLKGELARFLEPAIA